MPKIVDHDQRRAELIQVILKVMSEHGLAGTTIRTIARKGGFSSGVLSHYFTSKDEMVNFAFGAVAEAIFVRVDERLRTTKSPKDRVRLLVEELVPSNGVDQESIVSIAFWGTALHDPDLRSQFHERYENWRNYLRRELVAAVNESGSDETNIDDNVELLVSLADGFLISWTLDPKRYDTGTRQRLITKGLKLFNL
ncbi:TetR/AcrR family transcriptional regulator [Rhizobium leguminosarum]